MEYSVDEGVDREIREILTNLKFISKWADAGGKKLNLSKMQLIDDSWWNSMWRTLSGSDSREVAYKFITNSTNKAFDSIVKYYADNSTYKHKIGDMVLDHLKEARAGIKCSAVPYSDDIMYQSKIETFLNVFDVKITDIERKFNKTAKIMTLPPPPSPSSAVGESESE
jgi:hypothetical protein